jgi:hypothetical protein
MWMAPYSPSATAKITGQLFLKMKVGNRGPAISVGPRNRPATNSRLLEVQRVTWQKTILELRCARDKKTLLGN